jgi:hypothetical protein
MTVRDFRPSAHEEWSQRNQTLRHAGEKRPRDDQALLHNPYDYSGIGGPDDERVYGRVRSDSGYYPWNPNGGPVDRDVPPSQKVRGGYLKQCGLRSRLHHRLHEMIERRSRILAATGVNRRSLDDRAARRDQPVKALARR